MRFICLTMLFIMVMNFIDKTIKNIIKSFLNNSEFLFTDKISLKTIQKTYVSVS